MRMLDLFCGRLGWSKAFLARGWECVGVDLVEPEESPQNFEFIKANVLHLGFAFGNLIVDDGDYRSYGKFDFICASSPCEEFSKFGMPNLYPTPPYPAMGWKLFNHCWHICRDSGVPFVMENVRAAQRFVGPANLHFGPFYLWGTGVGPIMPQVILKGRRLMTGGYKGQTSGKSDKAAAAIVATIPPELANTVADFAERLLEQTLTSKPEQSQ